MYIEYCKKYGRSILDMKWALLYDVWNASGFGRYFTSYAGRSHHLFIYRTKNISFFRTSL